MASESSRIAMLVVSCDRYADLWEPCFTLLDKYWPDREFDVYLMTNFRDFDWPGIEVIKVGEDLSYAENLASAAAKIPADWILLWLEDLLLCRPVSSARVSRIIRSAQQRGAGYLKISPDMPLSYDAPNGEEIGPVPKGVRYRAAIGATFYGRTTLENLLEPGASAWDLDKSRKCDELPGEFLSLTVSAARNPPVPHVNSVIKGRWTREARELLRREGFSGLLPGRQTEALSSWLYRKAFVLRLNVLKIFRWHWR